MTEDKDKLGRLLAGKLESLETGTCPSTEDIAALADGAIQNPQRDELMRHISSCSDCYEIFSLTTELAQTPTKKRPAIFHPISMAASILVIAISVFIIFKSGVQLKQEESPLHMMDAVEEVAEEESLEPMSMEKADKEQLKAAPEKRIKKGAVRQTKQAPKKLKSKRKEADQIQPLQSQGNLREKKSRRQTVQEGAKMEYAGKTQSATPPAPATITGRSAPLDLQTQFKNSLEQMRKERISKDGAKKATLANEALALDITGYLNKSTPGTPEHTFFQLAQEGFRYNNKWYGGTPPSESLHKWKALLPRLDGVFRDIAAQTIRQLDNQAEVPRDLPRG